MTTKAKLSKGATVYRALPALQGHFGPRILDEGDTVSVETGRVIRSGEKALTVEWRFGANETVTHEKERFARTPYDALQTFEVKAREQIIEHLRQMTELERLVREAADQCANGAKMVGA
jgi:hypothetical protein